MPRRGDRLGYEGEDRDSGVLRGPGDIRCPAYLSTETTACCAERKILISRNSGGDTPDSCLAVGGVRAAAWTIMACREGRL